MVLLYNIAMLAVDAVAIWLARRNRGLPISCAVLGSAFAFALGFGFALAGPTQGSFGIIHLWCYALFLHGGILLTAVAILWRRTRPWLARTAALITVVLIAVAADAFLIEPEWLEVSHWRFASPKIHHPLRIVVVADLQTDRIGPYERRVLQQALAEEPDVIFLAGDYIQAPWPKQQNLRSQLRDLLDELHFSAPRGVFAVQGNIDPSDWHVIFDGMANIIGPGRRSFDLGDVRLTCIDLYESFNTSLVVTNDAPDRFHLVFGHMPNFALGKINADLCVTGHTHGGQVRLPFIGALMTKSLIPRAWAAGLTNLPGGSKLLVSRGIGTERSHAPPIRFLCRPELMVIDIVPE